MNSLENKMVEALVDLRENHAVIGVKAEFEAEGTRLEEAMRLKEVVTKADLGLTIKIGGCEALRDMYECRTIGVERIVSPMVESPYALKKYLMALAKAFPEDEAQNILMAINIETLTGCENFDAMLALPNIQRLNGIVIGRTDLTGSLGMKSDQINHHRIFEIAQGILSKAKDAGLETAIGGGVSAHSIPFFQKLIPGILDRFETRKVIFDCPKTLKIGARKGILKAVGFELLWLKNKRDYYSTISVEDDARMQELDRRYKHEIEEVGGLTS